MALGEKVAIATYGKTLEKDLPSHTREIITRQFEEVRKVVEQVRLMRGRDGKRMVVRLYDSKGDADRAIQSLKQAGIPENETAIENIDPREELYSGKGTTILETIISGAVGGAIWGTAAGILAAIGIFRMASFGPGNMAPTTLQFIAAISILGLIAGGSFIGGMIGLFIGWGITGEDRYINDHVLKKGQILVRAIVKESAASRAWHIMNEVAMEARVLRASATSA